MKRLSTIALIKFNVFMFNLIFKFQKLLRATIGYKGYWCEHAKTVIACDRINVIKYAYRHFSKMNVSVTNVYSGNVFTTDFKIELMPYGEASIHSSNCGYMGFRKQEDIVKMISL